MTLYVPEMGLLRPRGQCRCKSVHRIGGRGGSQLLGMGRGVAEGFLRGFGSVGVPL